MTKQNSVAHNIKGRNYSLSLLDKFHTNRQFSTLQNKSNPLLDEEVNYDDNNNNNKNLRTIDSDRPAVHIKQNSFISTNRNLNLTKTVINSDMSNSELRSFLTKYI
jgi:hypothetical protein